MENGNNMKSLRKCFSDLADSVSTFRGRLSNNDWFECAANTSPSAIGYIDMFIFLFILSLIYLTHFRRLTIIIYIYSTGLWSIV